MDYGALSGGMNIATSIYGNYVQNQIADLQADTANFVRSENNRVVTAQNARDKEITALQRWRQGVYNDRVMSNAANDQETLAVNFGRQQDARTRANFSQQIQYAEQEGRMQAQAAASGVTGGVTDMLSMAFHMKRRVQEQQTDEAGQQLGYDEKRKEFSQWWSNMDKLDNSMIFDSPRRTDGNTNFAQAISPLAGLKTADIKSVAQGFDFLFNKQADPLGDFIQRGTRGSGD